MDPRFLLDSLFKRWDRHGAISREDREALLALPWTHKVFARDAYLMREGEPTSVCSLLVSGYAFRQKLVDSGARQIISFHIPGEILDIQNCVFNVADHNLQALTRISVAVVQKAALLQLLAERPAVRRLVWLDGLMDASIFREWVVNVGRRDARARIAHLLCEFAARLTAVHTNRTLQSLRKDGLISLSSSRLAILDWDKLSEVGDFNERYLHHAS